MKRARRVLSLLTGAALAVAGLTAGPNTAQGAPGERIVSYHGYQVAVPAGWKVVDFGKDPSACVRFDQPAVYLGRPAEQQSCPAHLVGRTAGLVIEPLDHAVPQAAAVAASPGTAIAPAGVASANGEIQVAVEDAAVLVTAAHGSDQEQTVRRVLGEARLTSGGKAAKLVRPQSSPKAASANTSARPEACATGGPCRPGFGGPVARP
jgi:hypothetical protein